jgi:hypothetical protein
MHGEDDRSSQSPDKSSPRKVEVIEKLTNRLKDMSVNERTKLALVGDAEARRLLIRDSNRQVQMAVLQNPRITENEIISIANSRSTPDEMLRAIIGNREWYKHYAVRLALVKNPKTPPALAIRMVGGLVSSDLKLLANNKTVSPAVAQQASRLVFRKKQ